MRKTPGTRDDNQDGGNVMTGGEGRGLSRKRFLGALGIGAGAIALDPASVVAGAGGADAAHAHAAVRPENFGRMFKLPPFAKQTPKVEAALRELGKPGGLLDAKDPLAAGPKALIVDLSLSANNPNNPSQHGGHDVLRPVPRPRHDLRRELAARAADRSRALRATSARPRSTSTRSTARARWRSRSCTTPPTTSSSRSRAAASSRTCRAAPTARRSSATRATTST